MAYFPSLFMTSYLRRKVFLTRRMIERIAASIYILAIAILISGFWSPYLEVKQLACLGPPSFNCLMLPTWNWVLTIASITIVIAVSILAIFGNYGIEYLRQRAVDRERKKLAEAGFFGD